MTKKTFLARESDRVKTKLPVMINGVKAITRDVSSSGILLELNSPQEPGSTIEFLVQLASPKGDLTVSCKGQVVRVDEFEKKYGVATKILSMYMVSLLEEEGKA
ncbi:MAG: PilZ domain-containing protein [Polynucleobacter sp.]|jgi:hypothetical protein|nr:PilZ domain-containing protein [Polynucleobacter sp.]